MPLPTHWVNGSREASLAAGERGLAYGDGVFETFRCHAGQVHLWSYHRKRLQLGLEGLEIPCEQQRIDAQLSEGLGWLRANGIADAAGRLLVSRGVGPRGYGGDPEQATIVLSFAETSPWREPLPVLNIDISAVQLAEQPLLAGLKHCNRLEQVLAARDAAARGLDECLLATARGELVCGISANIFAVIDGVLITPPLERCGVAGTVRALILDELAAAAGLNVRVIPVESGALARADELFMTNALWGIRPVGRCGERRFTSSRLGDTLRSRFHHRCDSSEC